MIARAAPLIGTTLFALLAAFWAAGPAMAASPVSEHFAASGEEPLPDGVDAPWAEILAAYVSKGEDGIARFAYAQVTPDHRASLEAYLISLQGFQPTTLTREGQLAFWVNLYNALTVKVVLDHYPVTSIRRIKFGRFWALGPWDHDLVTIDGIELSLNDIEHRILRVLYDEPRIHYAINCASLGCPNLHTEPFDAARIEEQFDEAARTYINHPRGARMDNERLIASSIYDWFEEDFGGSDESVIAHIREYADADLADALVGLDQLSAHAYDWSLNEPATR